MRDNGKSNIWNIYYEGNTEYRRIAQEEVIDKFF